MTWTTSRNHNMKKYLCLIGIAFASQLARADETIPKEFWGKWVPKTQSCASKNSISINIDADGVEISDSHGKNIYRGIDICNSCEGGIQYNGIVLWASPKNETPFPFVLHLNANEKQGDVELDILDEALRKKFTSKVSALQNCARRTY